MKWFSRVSKLILALLFAYSVPYIFAQTFSVLDTFTGANGANPSQSNLLDIGGTLYGTTYYGGSFNAGTVLP